MSADVMAPQQTTVQQLAQEGHRLAKASEFVDLNNADSIPAVKMAGNIAVAGIHLAGEADDVPSTDSLGLGVSKTPYKDGYAVTVEMPEGVSAEAYESYPNFGEIVMIDGENSTRNPLAVENKRAILKAHSEFMKDAIVDRQVAILDGIATEIGSKLHDTWREQRRIDGDRYQQQEETTSDQSWIDKSGTNKVDIANTAFEDLPQDWQKENKDAANTITGLLVEMGTDVDLSNPKTRSLVGSKIHNAWLGRQNNSNSIGSNLDVPFDELPTEEQQKDINQFAIALEMLK